MKIPTHSELVKALLKPGQDIMNSLTIERSDALHNAVGVSGEAGEICEAILTGIYEPLDRDNIVEELGDMHFYLEGLMQNYNLPSFEFNYDGVESSNTTYVLMKHTVVLNAAAGRVLDAVKKEVIYNKPRDIVTIKPLILKLAGALAEFAGAVNAYLGIHATHQESITYGEVIGSNISKLMIRYSTLEYSDEQAQARADKAPDNHPLATSDFVHVELPDPVRVVEEAVIAKLRARGDVGAAKYGTTMDRTDLTLRQWITHLQEELLDGAQYAERLLAGADLCERAKMFVNTVSGAGSDSVYINDEASDLARQWLDDYAGQFNEVG